MKDIYEHIIRNDIRYLLFDSRHLLYPENTVFFAIKSEKNDGHKYIPELYRKGVRYFFIEKKINEFEFPAAHFYTVGNTIHALQELASIHRLEFNIPIIGITGSNGKTIVKEWLFQLLKNDQEVVRSPRSYNSQIGVPVSIWEMNGKHQLGIFEAGISSKGEMEKIAPVISCDIGIFTTLGTAHDAGFENRLEKAKEKAKLFHKAKKIIYRKDIHEFDQCIQKLKARKITWSFKEDADLCIEKIEPRTDGQSGATIHGNYKKEKIKINIPFSDEVSCHNAIICWLTLLEMGIPHSEINKKMQTLEPVSMRLELKKGISRSILINDTYNSDLTSLQSSLRFMESQAGDKRRIIILSDILQHDLNNSGIYSTIANWLQNEFTVNHCIGIGKNIRQLEHKLSSEITSDFYDDVPSFLGQIKEKEFSDAVVLVKGARQFKFERIVDRLEQQAHRTVLEINFNALKNNLQIYREQLNPETKIMVMVKASAYGAGAAEVAKMMETENVDYLTVAYIDEGVELRKEGIKTPIMVLNPEPSGFDALYRYDLEPEIYSLHQLKKLYESFLSLKKGGGLPIHLKLDTGMKRLGFEEKDLTAFILFARGKKMEIRSVFSHLAGSDAAEHDDFTHLQYIRFNRMYKRICEALDIRPMRHMLNSAGISRFPEYRFEMVRLGIGLYGIATDKKMKGKLQNISTLKATVSQIKELAPGESVGYNRGGKVAQPTRIATVGIGYADGLSRAAGYGKYSLSIRGQKAKTIGVICMDMCMIDITNIPNVQIGDEVIVFGNDPTINDLADCLHTIPYEILTSVSDRVKRIYLTEG